MLLTLAHLERPCGRCGRQHAVHVGGRAPTGWAIYDPIWANTTGWCTHPGLRLPSPHPHPRHDRKP